MTTETTPSTTPNAQAPAAEAAIPEAPPIASSSDFSHEQLRSMAADLVARGTLTRDAADALLFTDGAQIEQPKPEGELSPEAADIDALFPPAKPSEYQMPNMGETFGPAQQKLDADSRAWLAEARFPAGIGSALLAEVDKTATAWNKMDATARTLHVQKETSVLQKLWGNDGYAAKVNAARQLIKELERKRPGIVEILERSGAGNSAQVIAQVALHAERLLARRPKTA